MTRYTHPGMTVGDLILILTGAPSNNLPVQMADGMPLQNIDIEDNMVVLNRYAGDPDEKDA